MGTAPCDFQGADFPPMNTVDSSDVILVT
jgi:hypothetical protein